MIPASGIDALHLEFAPGALLLATVAFALMLYGVALDTPLSAFRSVLRRPGVIAIGILAQVVFLPAVAFALSLLLRVPGSVALGMLLLASCPAGSVSNVLTYRATGDAALSVSLSAIGNLLSVLTLPLNLMFWGRLHPTGGPVLEQLGATVHLSALSMLSEVATVILLPTALGILTARFFPKVAERLKKILGPFSLIALVAITGGAIAANWAVSAQHLGMIVAINAVTHLTFLGFGYLISRLFNQDRASTKALTFEVAARNSTLATLLVFTFFGGLGGMALFSAWSGAWSILAGVAIAALWKRFTERRQLRVAAPLTSMDPGE